MSKVGLAIQFERTGGFLTEATRDEIAEVNLKQPPAQILIAAIRKMWDTWCVKSKSQRDDLLEYDSFYKGL